MKKYIKLLLIIPVLFSCVSTKVPTKEKKAKRKLAKHLTGVKNIIAIHPELSDTFTVVKYDTIITKEHIVDTVIKPIHDTLIIDSMLYQLANDTAIITVEKIRYIRDKIIKEVLKDTTYSINDSIIDFEFKLQEGNYYFKYTVKQKEIPYTTTITHNVDMDCDSTRDFWRDYKFWLLLLIIALISWVVKNIKGNN